MFKIPEFVFISVCENHNPSQRKQQTERDNQARERIIFTSSFN